MFSTEAYLKYEQNKTINHLNCYTTPKSEIQKMLLIPDEYCDKQLW